MSTIDIALIVMMLIGVYSGYKEGFLLSLFSLLGIVLGVLGGFKLMGWAMIYLNEQFNVDEKVLPYIAFGLVFIAIVIAVSLFARMLKVSVDKSFLGRVDQIAGGALGLLKTAFMLSVLLWIVDSLKYDFPEKWTADSLLLPTIETFAPMITDWIGGLLPAFKNIF